jgi:hypothetical protein
LKNFGARPISCAITPRSGSCPMAITAGDA